MYSHPIAWFLEVGAFSKTKAPRPVIVLAAPVISVEYYAIAIHFQLTEKHGYDLLLFKQQRIRYFVWVHGNPFSTYAL